MRLKIDCNLDCNLDCNCVCVFDLWWYKFQFFFLISDLVSHKRQEVRSFFSTLSVMFFECAQLSLCVLTQSILAIDPFFWQPHCLHTAAPSSVHLHEHGWFCLRPPEFLVLCLQCFLLLPSSRSVYCRMSHTLQRKGDKAFLIRNCQASCSFTSPVFISSPISSHFVPDAPTVMPPPHVCPPGVVVRVIVHFNCLCGLPPSCACVEPVHTETF